MNGSARRLVRRVWAELDRDPDELARLGPLPEAPLPSRLDVSGLAVGAVAAASLAAASASGSTDRLPPLDGARIAAAFTSDRAFRQDGERPDVWAPLSGFFRAADGWVRTHGNYPHHARVLRTELGLAEHAGSDEVAAAIARRRADELAAAVTAAGGLCVVVRPEDPAVDARLAERPLIEIERLGEASARSQTSRGSTDAAAAGPLAGIRVLDLTRVIAGPVATRTLALFGADVLRIDPPEPAELAWQHLDSGAGKRSAVLDVRSPAGAAKLDELLAGSDAVVLGYRPGGLARLGLEPRALAERHPGLVVAQLSAWGFAPTEAERRGFDSLVQAESGIAVVEGDAARPGALPVQALDHATGYLLATAVITLLERQRTSGGSWAARMSLRRTAAELLTMPRTAEPTPSRALDDAALAAQSELVPTSMGELRLVRPAITAGERLDAWPRPPHAWGSDVPDWAS